MTSEPLGPAEPLAQCGGGWPTWEAQLLAKPVLCSVTLGNHFPLWVPVGLKNPTALSNGSGIVLQVRGCDPSPTVPREGTGLDAPGPPANKPTIGASPACFITLPLSLVSRQTSQMQLTQPHGGKCRSSKRQAVSSQALAGKYMDELAAFLPLCKMKRGHLDP